MHGGPSTGAPKGNDNAVKHGFYATALNEEDRKLYAEADPGDLTHEIKLARVKLYRMVQRSESADLQTLVDGALTVTRQQGEHPEFGPFDRSEIKAVAPTYAEWILKQLDVIRKLEIAQLQMKTLQKNLDGDMPDGKAPSGFEVVPYDD